MDWQMLTVGEYLRVPYIVEVWSEPEPAGGEWVRHAEHPELPGCSATAVSIEEALDLLTARRVEAILDLLARSHPPLVRKPLLGEAHARAELARTGLLARVDAIWDQTVDDYASSGAPS